MGVNERVVVRSDDEGLHLAYGTGKAIVLHPLWLRERAEGPDYFDPVAQQRLYEHAEFPSDLTIHEASEIQGHINLSFCDGHTARISVRSLLQELGWEETPENPPLPNSWSGSLSRLPQADWDSLDDPKVMKAVLTDYFTYGFFYFPKYAARS